MADFWLQVDMSSERSLSDLTAVTSLVVRLLEGEADVEVGSVALQRWHDDGGGDEVAPADPLAELEVDGAGPS